ncbi:hypothetical protein [Psychroserpens luteolus]|uniref:hypothetical protein n=1 Tax=Psychroserpens luteolus TaxID=2855840 RepID=UPI001E2EA2F0|nr:hypothetical protein [Psychroserpens luteolus]MCD2259195.1 hypothetical protein [Psychroserpens luteolus]
MNNLKSSRRQFVGSSIFGLLAVSIPNVTYASPIVSETKLNPQPNNRYPSIDDEVVNEVVGKSHFDIDTVKKLVDKRPELARASWDWSFGDWESAIGAASHVGRRDIVQYLMSKGARPTMYTYAMLGAFDIVKAMITMTPGVESQPGPHGISLLQHARAGLRMKDTMSKDNIKNSEKLIDFLTSFKTPDTKTYTALSDSEKQKYLGDYRYGDGENDGFSISLNMRKMISLGKLGKSGGGLIRIEEHKFLYNGISSVYITFQLENNKVKSLTIHEPDLVLVAKKV